MSEHESALKIQRFFAAYRSKKQVTSQQAITNSPNSALFRALDLRFQCMRAVAAAKFPLHKPLEDREQIDRVIHGVTELAKEKGITKLEAIAQLFQQNIVLSTAIQYPYYDLIWRKSHYGKRDIQKLIDNAYSQLRNLVLSFNLPIDHQDKASIMPTDVLALARDIIQYASKTMIEILATPTHPEFLAISHNDFAEALEQILANYMTPSVLSDSKETIQLFAQNATTFSI